MILTDYLAQDFPQQKIKEILVEGSHCSRANALDFINKHQNEIYRVEYDYVHRVLVNLSLFNNRVIALVKNSHFEEIHQRLCTVEVDEKENSFNLQDLTSINERVGKSLLSLDYLQKLAFFDTFVGEGNLDFLINKNKVFPFETHANITDPVFFESTKIIFFCEKVAHLKPADEEVNLGSEFKKLEEKAEAVSKVKSRIK